MYVTNEYSLAMDYHENSKLLTVHQSFDPKPQYKIYPSAKAIPLTLHSQETPTRKDDTFLHTLLSRRSTRSFSPENVNLETLSSLLSLSFGFRYDTEDSSYPLRTYASAGGCYPIEVYPVILRSDEMKKGIYHYNVYDNTLEYTKDNYYIEDICTFYSNQEEAVLTDYPCMILFSMVFERTMQKYGERGYRFMLIDAGHMGQNLYLTATYLNLGIVALGAGSMSDNRLDDALGLTRNQESAFYGFAVGHPLSPRGGSDMAAGGHK